MWVILLSLYWTAPLLAEDCSHPRRVESTKAPVEVYQLRHLDRANASTGTVTIQIDFLRNLVQLPSKTLCEYDAGSCRDPKTDQDYTWSTYKNSTRTDTSCEHLIRFYYDLNYTYTLLTLRRDPLVTFALAENSLSIYYLQLVEEETFCGKKIWRTDHSDLVVAVGEENYIEAAHEPEDLTQPVGVAAYSLESRDAAYAAMISKCGEKEVQTRLDRYRDEIAELRKAVEELQKDLVSRNAELARLELELDGVRSVKSTVHGLQRKLNRYRQENVELRQNLARVESEALDYDEATEVLDADFDKARASAKVEAVQSFYNVFDGYKNCPNYILFPYENIFCILAAVSYVFFAVLNTLTNYFALRMLLSKKQRWCCFYTLTNGLTTWYVCRSQALTRRRIDKWLLDLE